MQPRVLVLNGPGLGDLSDFDGNTYGGITLQDIHDACAELCRELEIGLDFRQTDDKDEMFRWITRDSEEFDGVVINPIGYSRSFSVSFPVYRSATEMIARLNKPVVEVHMNNIFRASAGITQPVYEPEGNMGFVCGLGVGSYLTAIQGLVSRFNKDEAD